MHGSWRVVYDGYGTVTGTADQVSLAPEVATSPTVTHAALVVHTSAASTLSARITTSRQLRSEAPNAWEVAWLLFRYTDPDHFYSIVLKPNGWELGKENPAFPGKQEFLASSSSPTFAVGSRNDVTVRLNGPQISVEVNGKHLVSYSDTDSPYLQGTFALYTEDADVEFSELAVS